MKKASEKPNLLIEINARKVAEQKAGVSSHSFGKFKPNKQRNENNSNVGPSWGKRKGN